MIAYTFNLLFPKKPKEKVVSNIDYQVTSDPLTLPQLHLPQNTMPQTFYPGDTITFTYNPQEQKESPVAIDSCIYTLYPLRDTTEQNQYRMDGKEQITDFVELFDKPIEITPAFKGTWIFHLLGMYTQDKKTYSFYLDPEASCG